MNTNFKDDFVEYKCLCCKKNYQQKFDEKSKEQFFNTYNFLTRTTISLFCFWEKVFTLMNTSLIWKKKRKDKEDNVHTDYEDTERVFKDKKIRKI